MNALLSKCKVKVYFSQCHPPAMKNPYILMVENDEDDRYITMEYFNESSIPVRIVSRTDELFSELDLCIGQRKSLPALILMNLYSSPISTRDALFRLKGNPSYTHIPVIILSESVNEDRIKETYSWGATSFIRKPALVEETNRTISTFISYWFEIVELA